MLENKDKDAIAVPTTGAVVDITDALTTPWPIIGGLIGVEMCLYVVLILLARYRLVHLRNTGSRKLFVMRLLSAGVVLVFAASTMANLMYSVIWFIAQYHNLVLCQPPFVLIVSWTWTNALIFADVAINVVPSMDRREMELKIKQLTRVALTGDAKDGSSFFDVKGTDDELTAVRTPSWVRKFLNYFKRIVGGATLLWYPCGIPGHTRPLADMIAVSCQERQNPIYNIPNFQIRLNCRLALES